jgi:hypothetical protein
MNTTTSNRSSSSVSTTITTTTTTTTTATALASSFLKCSWTVLYCPIEECSCDAPFSTAEGLLKHLKDEHGLVISRPEEVVPFLDRYLKAVIPDSLYRSPTRDTEIRHALHVSLLKTLLDTQQNERLTLYRRPRSCLFCVLELPGLRGLFEHMYQEHGFNIGLLDNIIGVEAFLNELEALVKLRKQCLYCKEVFRNGTCLRKHIKSKRHCKIDAKDRHWDRFYLINYVNLLKGSGCDDAKGLDEVSDGWSDLEDSVDEATQCLFCIDILSDPDAAFEHMSAVHGFDFYHLKKENKLDFYSGVKILNFLRNCQRHERDACIETFQGKMALPDKNLWDRPEFYFPLYEDDPLLTAVDDFDPE